MADRVVTRTSRRGGRRRRFFSAVYSWAAVAVVAIFAKHSFVANGNRIRTAGPEMGTGSQCATTVQNQGDRRLRPISESRPWNGACWSANRGRTNEMASGFCTAANGSILIEWWSGAERSAKRTTTPKAPEGPAPLGACQSNCRHADLQIVKYLFLVLFSNQLPGHPLLDLHHCAQRCTTESHNPHGSPRHCSPARHHRLAGLTLLLRVIYSRSASELALLADARNVFSTSGFASACATWHWLQK